MAQLHSSEHSQYGCTMGMPPLICMAASTVGMAAVICTRGWQCLTELRTFGRIAAKNLSMFFGSRFPLICMEGIRSEWTESHSVVRMTEALQ